jgi:nitrogenase molybdenum-iron protein alpha/beta subunit
MPGQPYGPEATKEWLLGVAKPLVMEAEAMKVIEREMQEVEPEIEYLKQVLSGKTAVIEISEFPGPKRALSLARMAAEFGAQLSWSTSTRIRSRNVCPASNSSWKKELTLRLS